MKYVALLRGINVGGNNKISMAELKKIFEEAKLENVKTYINSGNVLFETTENDQNKLASKLEKLVETQFKVTARILLKTEREIKHIVEKVPKEWATAKNIRCYVSFLFDSLKTEDAVKEIQLREGVDSLQTGPAVLYMTSDLNQLTKSAFNKLASKKIYQDMTIRNFNTSRKILELLEKE